MSKYLTEDYETYDKNIKTILNNIGNKKEILTKELPGIIQDALDRKIDSGIVITAINNINDLDAKVNELGNLNDELVYCKHCLISVQKILDFNHEQLEKETNEFAINEISNELVERQAEKDVYNQRLNELVDKINLFITEEQLNVSSQKEENEKPSIKEFTTSEDTNQNEEGKRTTTNNENIPSMNSQTEEQFAINNQSAEVMIGSLVDGVRLGAKNYQTILAQKEDNMVELNPSIVNSANGSIVILFQAIDPKTGAARTYTKDGTKISDITEALGISENQIAALVGIYKPEATEDTPGRVVVNEKNYIAQAWIQIKDLQQTKQSQQSPDTQSMIGRQNS